MRKIHRRTISFALPVCIVLASCSAQPEIASVLAPVEPQAFTTPANFAANSAKTVSSNGPTAKDASASSLEATVNRALAWHPSIDEAVGRLNQRTSEIDVARSGYRPKVSGGIRSFYDGDEKRVTPQLNVSASQMLFDFGKVRNSVEVAVAGVDVRHAQLLSAVDTVIRDTAHAYIETQRNIALLQAAEAQAAGVGAIADLVRQRSDSGASTRSDEVQAEAREQAARTRVIEITTQLNRWQNTLASLTGREGGAVTNTVPQWLLNACATAEPNWAQVPAALRAEAERKEAEAQLQLSRAQIYPTLSVQADAGYDLDGSRRGTGSSSERLDYTVGLNVSGNLYDGGATSARREAASYGVKAAEAARETARLQALQSLTGARTLTANMNQLLASLSSRQGMMVETRDLYRRQYIELGTRTLLDLLNAEQELHQAQFDIVNTTHDLRRLNVDCLFEAGLTRTAFSFDDASVRGVPLKR